MALTIDVGKTWKFDGQFDLYISPEGMVEYVDGPDKVVQDITYTLHTMKKEDMFHVAFGVDLQSLTYAKSDQSIEDIVRDALSMYPYISSIEDVRLISRDTTNRTMTISFTIVMIDQSAPVSITVVI